MNAKEEPYIFKELMKYLQDTYKFSITESMNVVGKIENLIRKERKEIDKQKQLELDHDNGNFVLDVN